MASAESKNEQLWRACERGDLAAVQEAIRNKEIDLNWCKEESPYLKCTPLHIAVVHGHKPVVLELLRKGVYTDSQNDSQYTPLMTAARKGDSKIVKHLLKWNALTNIHGHGGDTALHKAAKYAHMDVITMLVEAQAPIDEQNEDGNTPLHLAAIEGHVSVVQYLLKRNADASIQNKNNQTALDEAMEGNQTVTRIMFQKQEETQILWNACCSGDLATVRVYVDKGDLDWKNPSYGCTMLHIAAEYHHDEVVLELLKKGACTDSVSEKKDTPLIVAANNGDETIVQHLIDHKAKFDAINEVDNTALHVAASHCHTSVVKLLVNAGAKLDVQNNEGNTPLHLASQDGHTEVVYHLLYKAANRHLTNKNGKTPVQLAEDTLTANAFGRIDDNESSYASSGPSSALEASNKDMLWNACSTGNIDMVMKLTTDGEVDLNLKSPEMSGFTPVLIATAYGHVDIVEELLQRRADPNIPSDEKLTPLMKASMEGKKAIASLLVNNKANVNAVDQNQESALHKAALRAHRDVVELLVENNANMELKDKDGNTPLHLAAKHGKSAVVRYLVEQGADKSAKNKDGRTAEDLAEAAGYPVTLSELRMQDEQDIKELPGFSKKTPEEKQSYLLWKASHRGDLQKVKDILSTKKANPNWKNPEMNEYTSLQVAVKYDYTDVMSTLMEYKADPNIRSERTPPALILAAKNGGVKASRLLLDFGETQLIDEVDCDGNTALHMAVMRPHKGLVELLCEKGASLDAANKDGDTPLHLAAKHDHPHILKLLLAYGANQNLKNNEGKDPYDIANEANHSMVIDQLVTKTREQKKKTAMSKQRELLQAERAQAQMERSIAALKCELEESQIQVKNLSEEKKQLHQEMSAYMVTNAALHKQSVEDTGVQADYLAIAPGSLRGVEVCGETVLEVVGNKSQKLKWPGYGFFLEVPDGAVPEGKTVSVGVKAILAGQFLLPEDSQLMSAIYWISSSKVFLEKVAVNIQHCAVIRSEEECSKFRFIIAKCSQEELPYRFREKEGVFNPYTQYATIKLKQFSIVGVTTHDEKIERGYTTLQFYKQIPNTANVDFSLVVVHDLQAVLESVKKHYQEWRLDEQSRRVCFESDTITLDLPDPPVVDHWKIVPMTPPQITKADVDQFKPEQTIPSCLVWLEWTGGEQVPLQTLCQKVTLEGAKSPAFFHIRHDPQAVGGRYQAGAPTGAEVPLSTSSAATPLAPGGATIKVSTSHADPLSDTPTFLKLKKMTSSDGVKVTQKIAASDYETFGMCLLQDENGVKVDLIKKNHSQEGAEGITHAILKEWLRNGPEHTLTYEHLIESLRESELGALADDIAKSMTEGGYST